MARLIASILPTYLRNRGNSRYRSLGASGAVSATLFAFILLQPWAKILVFVVPMPAILFAILYVVYEFWQERQASDNVNHGAHLWGAAYGVLFTIIMEPRVIGVFFSQLLSRLILPKRRSAAIQLCGTRLESVNGGGQAMKRRFGILLAAIALFALGGCVYTPGYYADRAWSTTTARRITRPPSATVTATTRRVTTPIRGAATAACGRGSG